MSDNLTVKLGPLALRNPIMVASGTFGYGLEYEDTVDLAEIGAVCVKGISLEPRLGNPAPRIVETSAGMLNAIGLANVGYDTFVDEKMPRLRELGVCVIVNTYGTSPLEFAQLAHRLDGVDGIAALEVNISCPNVKDGGMHFGVCPESAASVVRAVRQETQLPVIVKLSPEAQDLAGVAQAAVDAGADILSLINTIRGLSIDVKTRQPRLATVFGGLSGPAIRPIALRMVHEVYRAVDVPLIGIGGVTNLNDVLSFFMAGASAVQVGTANFANPLTSIQLIDDLRAYCIQHHLAPAALVGSMVTSVPT